MKFENTLTSPGTGSSSLGSLGSPISEKLKILFFDDSDSEYDNTLSICISDIVAHVGSGVECIF